MAYQSLPWQRGDSQSFAKLLALHLPSLKGKSFLDVGCNTGYFCGWAAFEKSTRVLGIDKRSEAIVLAKDWFTDCEFSCTTWDELSSEQFDIVLCLSALHYAENQEALIDTLMQRVTSSGVLVLELGIAPGDKDVFEAVQRSIDVRYFPTQKKLHSMLSKYAFKRIGGSVQQAGDPIPRFVYHIRHKLPVAILLMDEHYSGKSSLAKTMFSPHFVHVFGDNTYSEIAHGKRVVSEALRDIIKLDTDSCRLDCALITETVCRAGLLPELLDLYISLADAKDCIFDAYIPEAFKNTVGEAFERAGFFVAGMYIYQSQRNTWIRNRPSRDHYTMYSRYLEKMGLIDEDAYLIANPDVAKAIAEKKMPNAQYHYYHFGRHEKRKLGR